VIAHLRKPSDDFQPTNVVWSLFPALDDPKLRKDKKGRHEKMAERALADLETWISETRAAEARVA